MARYGMVIDLKRCYGCVSCVMACKLVNRTPPGVLWSRVLRGEAGVFPNSNRQALPVLCNQCEEPDCMKVCPTGATYQTDDGIVRVDKNKCIGCKYCMQACPYGARQIDEILQVATVNPALCQACGACAAACPNKASVVRNWTPAQIMFMADVLV